MTEHIPTEKIQKPAVNLRGSNFSVTELADNIEQQDMLQDVLVRPSNGKYEVIAGHRRYQAVRELGWDEVPCRVVDMNDDESLVAMLSENEFREPVNKEERAKLVAILLGREDLLERFDIDPYDYIDEPMAPEELAEQVGRKGSSAAEYWLEPIKQQETTRELVEDGDLNEHKAEKIRKFAKDDPEGEEKLAEAVAEAETAVVDRREFQRELSLARERDEEPEQLAERIKRKEKVSNNNQNETVSKVKPEENSSEDGQTMLRRNTEISIEPGRDLIGSIQRASEDRAVPMDELVQIAIEQWLDERGYL